MVVEAKINRHTVGVEEVHNVEVLVPMWNLWGSHN